ncbi:UDP-N-acetylmuramoylalanyl-D-glutamate--2,6-diaminopimelate ligase [Gloeomargarita lithophora Alchichica-D10]|uniref:UDP-N-acetylmuramoyl-L-alanyl-D-glutamate--2,6-diaminopimelate ligase n=1 Tax=Gloeomargarita lithophora Alchichica-D10 TaxID=1188229 RepID=A0A1J0AEM3_9CYAN|nr:UDP-N-acetylmuramoyl-L-alanyl-D-glutamate--2,6-diaminopimelate ligase [Gloeomargarita lithophora]APB34373.1 UDP-N-acetylmuramoylalanyl-D-glutamate--2,6-diaminopimelate ligase [Gloeomargarita lithophora Alchichica-D10]
MELGALLRTIASSLPPLDWHSPLWAQPVTGITCDSRQCQPGMVFVGLPGTQVDGGDFWPQALANGALLALVTPRPDLPAQVLTVTDITPACGELAAAFYGYPRHHLQMVGVTGTNGKTTTTHVLEFLLQNTLGNTALLGTLYNRWPGYSATASHTTPGVVDLQRDLAQAVQAGCTQAVMEVSSHALAQGRVAGCQYDVAVFTNLTQDHLDFHLTMEHYFRAKARLFEPHLLRGRAIVNHDDPYGQRLLRQLQQLDTPHWSTSATGQPADIAVEQVQYTAQGIIASIHTPLGQVALTIPLMGQFNLANTLAAVGAALHLGVGLDQIQKVLPQFPGVPGRMERVRVSPAQDITVVVDYAHTPDGLENCLRALRPFVSGQLICVFGCGGDRDKTKRPQMGKIAADLSDVVVVTCDNPRTEDPQAIIQDIVAGMPSAPLVLPDRREAIQRAIQMATPGDGVMIAGKGHEDYQILGTTKIHFDDREQAQIALKTRLG